MIDWLFKHLQPSIQRIVVNPLPVFIISILFAIGGLLLALKLKIDDDLSRLIPQDYPSVQALNNLRAQVGGEHEAAVAIHSPSFEANKKFAERLIPLALKLKDENSSAPYFIRAEFRKNIDFLKHNALYFATSNELDLLEKYLHTEIKKAKQKANPFYLELEDEPSSDADSVGAKLNSLYDELVGSEYALSPDSTVLVIKFFPSGAQTDLRFIQNAYHDLNTLIRQLKPTSFHKGMEVVAAGRMIRTLIEVQAITKDVKESFGAGVLMLVIVVIIYFFYKSYRARAGLHFIPKIFIRQLAQIPAHTLIIVLPLALSLCWTFGSAWLAFKSLNIMTSTLGLLLFGMGIDFGIHFFARYAEERGAGNTVNQSVITTFMTTGQAIFVVGLTTAAAFFILMLADFRGFYEFGFIAGIGLLFAIFAYIIFLPALLVLLERSPLLDLEIINESSPVKEITAPGKYRKEWMISLSIVLISLALTLFSLINLPSLSFEYDFSKLEPTYQRFIQLNRLVWKVYSDSRTRNAAYIIVDQPSEAPLVAKAIRLRAMRDTTSPTVRDVETFQDRFPFTRSGQQKKLERIERIRKLLDDPFIRNTKSDEFGRLRLAAETRHEIPLSKVPDFLKAPFTSTSGQTGNLVIIYPSLPLSDGRNSMAFADDVGMVKLDNGHIYHAGSTSIVASDMLRLMLKETPIMVILTIIFIIIFKLTILRGLKWTILALLPLMLSFIWLFGLLETIGWKLNFYNLVVLPTILGIGDDSGIHIIHRYQEEGRGSIKKVLSSTGEHIIMSGLTTMLGFGGLLFSIHPGMRSIGEIAVAGIGLSLLAALILLPSLLKLLELKTFFPFKKVLKPYQ